MSRLCENDDSKQHIPEDNTNKIPYVEVDSKYPENNSKDGPEHPFCTLSGQLLSLHEPHIDRCLSSSVFRSGLKFYGHQKSKGNSYRVEITIRYVDFRSSEVFGFLQIANLTDHHPILTTYFDGEIIGSKYSFFTNKWGADAEVDEKHWKQFPLFQPFQDSFANDDFNYDDVADSGAIFMRWKERFTIPELKTRDITGASFAGFYYICYDKKTQEINGFYYHRQSEWYQSLTLSTGEEQQPIKAVVLS